MGRAAVFLDQGYFERVTGSRGNISVDYESFTNDICDPDRRFRTYWYHCPPWQDDPPTDEQRRRFGNYQRFKDALSYLDRFKIREGRLQKIGEDYKQKKVDIMLSVDAVKLASTGKIDRALFITGDSDFVPVFEGIEGTGVTTTLCYDSNLPVHDSLLATVDERLEIDRGLLDKNRHRMP